MLQPQDLEHLRNLPASINKFVMCINNVDISFNESHLHM